MTRQSLTAQFTSETRTTRRLLERIPAEQFGWRPHPKSFTAGELASHLVECLNWLEVIFTADEFDVDPSTFRPYRATSPAGLLKTFDDQVTRSQAVLAGLDEAALHSIWRLTVRGKLVVERTKEDAVRDFTLSHMIHHRGQLSVYLRLLDVAVPGSYGPTADERG